MLKGEYFDFLDKRVAIVGSVAIATVFCSAGLCFGFFFGMSVESVRSTSVAELAIATIPAEVTAMIATEKEPAATDTSLPPATAAPTDTPLPPTEALPPTETFTPTPVPEPVEFSGQGDSILDVELWGPGILHIVGNNESRHFAVETISDTGEMNDLLVNTTEPYDGRRPIDWYKDQMTRRLRISAFGPWQITYYPFVKDYFHTLTVPGEYQGVGDDVILLIGEKPDLATIQGNSESRHFAVVAYHDRADLLVNVVEPYQGVVIIPPGTNLLEIVAQGSWSIQVSSK